MEKNVQAIGIASRFSVFSAKLAGKADLTDYITGIFVFFPMKKIGCNLWSTETQFSKLWTCANPFKKVMTP